MDRIDRFSASILSVLLGLITILLLEFIDRELLHLLEVFPEMGYELKLKMGYELKLIYISLSIVLGSYITSRIASKFIHKASMGHSIVLGIIVFIVLFFISFSIGLLGPWHIPGFL